MSNAGIVRVQLSIELPLEKLVVEIGAALSGVGGGASASKSYLTGEIIIAHVANRFSGLAGQFILTDTIRERAGQSGGTEIVILARAILMYLHRRIAGVSSQQLVANFPGLTIEDVERGIRRGAQLFARCPAAKRALIAAVAIYLGNVTVRETPKAQVSNDRNATA